MSFRFLSDVASKVKVIEALFDPLLRSFVRPILSSTAQANLAICVAATNEKERRQGNVHMKGTARFGETYAKLLCILANRKIVLSYFER